MQTPNSIQVKKHFGELMIKSLSSTAVFWITNPNNVFMRLGCFWYRTESGDEELIWDDFSGYAKIVNPPTSCVTKNIYGKDEDID